MSLLFVSLTANQCAESSLQSPKRWNFQNKPSPTTGGAATPARDSSFQSPSLGFHVQQRQWAAAHTLLHYPDRLPPSCVQFSAFLAKDALRTELNLSTIQKRWFQRMLTRRKSYFLGCSLNKACMQKRASNCYAGGREPTTSDHSAARLTGSYSVSVECLLLLDQKDLRH